MKTHFCLNCNSQVKTLPTEERSCCPDPNIIECDDSEIKREQASRIINGVEVFYTKQQYVKDGNFKYYV